MRPIDPLKLPKVVSRIEPEDRRGRASTIALRLSLDSERDAAIAEIVAVYKETKSLDKTAERFDLSSGRILQIWRKKVPALAEAIAKARSEMFPPR